ncbi:hypothetical protein [Okeania sp.]|uniref:hypothetical protein n=1 Tax=Okeania sp. TaxID=3100323 RepID=UPI002B4B5953|nr:hypothetical protein [Okeania sp.]MEB3342636.1 hypothetical protein [Okeania sp.]
MAKPSFSRPVNCKRFNYLEVDLIARNGHRTRYCLIGRERNQNGAIYKVGVPHTDEGATIYAGKSGDAIIEVYQGRYVDRIDGSWRRVGDEFYFQFSGAKVYIPVF